MDEQSHAHRARDRAFFKWHVSRVLGDGRHSSLHMNSMMLQPEWTINDGWILMSAFVVNGDFGATLPELIGAADMMNHAIPTKGELSRALTKLASVGVIPLAQSVL